MFWKAFLTLLVCIGLYFFCNFQTKGFRLQQILTDIPNDPKWEISPLPQEKQQEVDARLKQTFRYLGSGLQSHAFLGSDQKTVLKFFIHSDASVPSLFHRWKFFRKHDPRCIFDSTKLAFEHLQEQCGLLYVHLNKTENKFPPVILLDNIGVAHTVDLDHTEFMVQEYCELIFPHIDGKMKSGRIEEAKKSITAVFEAVEQFSRMGIHIDHPVIRRNFGFFEDKVMLLDVGSFRKDESFKSPEHLKAEMNQTTPRLGRWLKKHHPTLLPFFEQEMAKREIKQ